MATTLDDLAKLFSNQKAIPFLGSGCSAALLPIWDQLRDEMAIEIKISSEDHLFVAQKYEEEKGRLELIKFLKDKLWVEEVQETDVPVYSALLAMNIGWHYTTNQDNVFELLFISLGRQLDVIADLEDLTSRNLYIPVLYKFHGRLDKPDTVVFTRADYTQRIAMDGKHPLDIRLTSDLLGKSLVFFGYSFNDPNVQLLFRELNKAFPNGLPPSYLIQYRSNLDFADSLQKEYGVHVITPTDLVKDVESEEKAFEVLVSTLAKRVFELRANKDIQDLFSSPGHPERVLADRELFVLEEAIVTNSKDLRSLVEMFRGICDGTRIPNELESRVVDLFTELAKRVSCVEEVNSLQGAYFNIQLNDPWHWMEVLAALMSTGNVYPNDQGFVRRTMFIPVVRFAKRREDVYVYAAAMAICLLRDWEREIQPGLHHCIACWNLSFLPRKQIEKKILPTIEEAFRWAYQRHITTYENPLDYADRVNGSGDRPFRSPGFNEIKSRIAEQLPKRFVNPTGD